MFGNTLTLPHADGNRVLVKIDASKPYESEYLLRASDKETTVRIRHSETKPAGGGGATYERHNVEVKERIFATAEKAEYYRKWYIVGELLPSETDVKLVDALADWLIATANANVTSLLGKES
jgi:hypothetical protein